MSQYEMEWKPKPGQIILYADFQFIKHRTIAESLTLLEKLGYEPELRYLESENEQGDRVVKLFALLKNEQHDPSLPIPDEYMEGELERLYEAFLPDDMAIGRTKGLTRKQVA